MSEETTQGIIIPEKYTMPQITGEFKEALELIQTNVQKVETVLQEAKDTQDPEKLKEIAGTAKLLKEPFALVQNVRVEGRRFFENGKVSFSEMFDNHVAQYGYNKFAELDRERIRIEQELKAQLKSARWDELKEEYDTLMAGVYAPLKTQLPDLTFIDFKRKNEDVVTANKQHNITPARKQRIATFLTQVSDDVKAIKERNSDFEAELLKAYQIDFDLHAAIAKDKALTAQQKAAEQRRIERMKAQAERVRKANEREKQKAKLTGEKPKEIKAVYMPKLAKIYEIVQAAVAEGPTEASAKTAYEAIEALVNNNKQ